MIIHKSSISMYTHITHTRDSCRVQTMRVGEGTQKFGIDVEGMLKSRGALFWGIVSHKDRCSETDSKVFWRYL